MTDDIAAWLTEIWDAQAEAAQLEKELTDGVYAAPEFTVKYQWARMTRHASGGYGSSFAQGAPSPTEVLARIAADRAILAECSVVLEDKAPERVQERVLAWAVVRQLASAHRDRPNWREAWQ